MKLRYSTTSPFVRKVHVLALETGQIDKIELVKTNTGDPNSDHGKDNPLNKVPALALDDGSKLYDSRVICEYLRAIAQCPERTISALPGWAYARRSIKSMAGSTAFLDRQRRAWSI